MQGRPASLRCVSSCILSSKIADLLGGMKNHVTLLNLMKPFHFLDLNEHPAITVIRILILYGVNCKVSELATELSSHPRDQRFSSAKKWGPCGLSLVRKINSVKSAKIPMGEHFWLHTSTKKNEWVKNGSWFFRFAVSHLMYSVLPFWLTHFFFSYIS